MKRNIPNKVEEAIECLNTITALIENTINTPEFEREGANKYYVPISPFSAIAEWNEYSENDALMEMLIGLNQKYSPQSILLVADPTNDAYCITAVKVNDKSSDKVKKIYESLKKELFN